MLSWAQRRGDNVPAVIVMPRAVCRVQQCAARSACAVMLRWRSTADVSTMRTLVGRGLGLCRRQRIVGPTWWDGVKMWPRRVSAELAVQRNIRRDVVQRWALVRPPAAVFFRSGAVVPILLCIALSGPSHRDGRAHCVFDARAWQCLTSAHVRNGVVLQCGKCDLKRKPIRRGEAKMPVVDWEAYNRLWNKSAWRGQVSEHPNMFAGAENVRGMEQCWQIVWGASGVEIHCPNPLVSRRFVPM